MAKVNLDGRTNMRLPPDLKKWAQDYAQRNHTNLTQIYVDHLMELRDLDKASKKGPKKGKRNAVRG
jgi:PIN domain nuclease of toxin-antitoxin system